MVKFVVYFISHLQQNLLNVAVDEHHLDKIIKFDPIKWKENIDLTLVVQTSKNGNVTNFTIFMRYVLEHMDRLYS